MNTLLSLSRRRNSYYLLNHPRILRRFSADVNPPPGIKPESQESVEARLLENLRKIPHHDWASSETLSSLLATSLPPPAFSQITRRLGSYSLAVSFFHYLDAKSQSLNRREESLSLVFQSAIEFAGSEPDAKAKLLSLYETATEKNIPLTVVATKLLIRWFSRMGMVNESVLVYERLDSGVKNTQVRNVVIDVLFRNKRVDDAFKVLDEMLCKGSVFRPNRITADIVFHEVWRGRLLNEEEIVGLISRFGSHGVAPNCVWLTRFITSLCRNARTDVAWEVLSVLMKNRAAPLQAPSFNALLTVLGRNMEIGRMNDVVVKMVEIKVRPDVVTLGILINTLCKSRRVDEALEVFQEMCGKRTDDGDVIKADSIHFNTLIDGLCKVGRMKEAEELLVKMKTEEGCAPTTVTYNCLIGGYCIAGQLETAKEVVSRMKEDGIKPNVVTLNTLIGGMCRHHGVNMAIAFFADMQREGLQGAWLLTALIHAYCSVGNIENAMGLFDQLLEDGCSPDAKIYYALISGLCQARRDHGEQREKVYEMLTDMEGAKMKPDSITYNTLVSFFCKLKDFESVQKMMENMREDGLHPTVVTYGVIIEAYCSAGDVSEALKLFNDMGSRSKVSPNTVIVQKMMENMREDGLHPTVVTYGVIIEAYCSAGDVSEALKLFNDMGSRSKVSPNTVMYNILINAFCKAGNLGQAMSLKEEMKEKMVRPNVETYNALFKCLNEVHQKETVFKLMDEMNQSSCEANQTTVEILMERLTSSDDLIKLKQFMQGYPVGYKVEKNFSFPCL
ncbi:hypothetical protein Bca52824_082598 [Brassica carinata]|uniref:Pentatricopeptide repeat-containing protein n=1 Tax=Brassica carinata TaxID=52824 RepID=A0A8X7PKQ0_BRACI|nr:hypothetical protein Bca52824_082598 [Brassica carinata]